MKILVLAALLSLPAIAQAQEGDSCRNIRLLLPSEASEQPQLQPTGISIEVMPSATGLRGWIAKISLGENSNIEANVAVKDLTATEATQAKALASRIKPELPWMSVAKVRAMEVAVEKNREDGNGATIYLLQDSLGKVQAKLVQLGWAFGECE